MGRSASDLYAKLEVQAEELNINIKREKSWPKSPSWLWRRMREVLPLLTAMGIDARQHHVETGSTIGLVKMPNGPELDPDGNPDSTKVTTDGTKAGMSVVDEATGKEIDFTVGMVPREEVPPGGNNCVLAAALRLEEDEAGEARRASLEVIRGGSSA